MLFCGQRILARWSWCRKGKCVQETKCKWPTFFFVVLSNAFTVFYSCDVCFLRVVYIIMGMQVFFTFDIIHRPSGRNEKLARQNQSTSHLDLKQWKCFGEVLLPRQKQQRSIKIVLATNCEWQRADKWATDRENDDGAQRQSINVEQWNT